MKMRNKGKVHPFTTSSSSSSSSTTTTNVADSYSVLNLLPAAILTLISILSLEERQVLAYMITRSLKSTNPSFFPVDDKKKSSKKQCCHKSPALFDCDCFHCYTSFWFRWDSSPNRELIHHAIEAFDDHLNNGDLFKKGPANAKTKRKDRVARRKLTADASPAPLLDFPADKSPECQDTVAVVLPEIEAVMEEAEEVERVVAEDTVAPAVVVRSHKGLARKVLPDVIGIFSSRLWSLWSPNV